MLDINFKVEGTVEQELAFAVKKGFKTTETIEEEVELFDKNGDSAGFNTETKEVLRDYTQQDVELFLEEYAKNLLLEDMTKTYIEISKEELAKRRAEEDRLLEEGIKAQVLSSQI